MTKRNTKGGCDMPHDAVRKVGDLVWAYRIETSEYTLRYTIPPGPGMLACAKSPRRNARMLARVPDARNACRFFVPLKHGVDPGPGYVPEDHPADLNWKMVCKADGFRFADEYPDAVREYADGIEAASASVVTAVRNVLAEMKRRGVE